VAFSNQPIEDAAILTSFAKTFEVKNEDYLLIVWPSLSTSAQNLANFYKIRIIQTASLVDLTRSLNDFLEGSTSS